MINKELMTQFREKKLVHENAGSRQKHPFEYVATSKKPRSPITPATQSLDGFISCAVGQNPESEFTVSGFSPKLMADIRTRLAGGGGQTREINFDYTRNTIAVELTKPVLHKPGVAHYIAGTIASAVQNELKELQERLPGIDLMSPRRPGHVVLAEVVSRGGGTPERN